MSDNIGRLQSHGFKWEDESFEVLIEKYPNCKSALLWWCSKFKERYNFKGYSQFDIGYNKYLKEFILQNPPYFKISSKCCYYAKKRPAKNLGKKYNADLQIIGVRKAEGGIRSTSYKSCFDIRENGEDKYRPIFWYKDDTKKQYESKFNIEHSACYTKYGFKRTGCCCCPYGRNLEEELEVTRIFEPKLYKAVCNVFKDSYDYTREYRKFVEMMKLKEDKTQIEGQMDLSDFIRG